MVPQAVAKQRVYGEAQPGLPAHNTVARNRDGDGDRISRSVLWMSPPPRHQLPPWFRTRSAPHFAQSHKILRASPPLQLPPPPPRPTLLPDPSPPPCPTPPSPAALSYPPLPTLPLPLPTAPFSRRPLPAPSLPPQLSAHLHGLLHGILDLLAVQRVDIEREEEGQLLLHDALHLPDRLLHAVE